MLVGYARTSTLEQVAGMEAQAKALGGMGCEKLYSEQASSVGDWPILRAAMDFCREGDALVVTKLDRLARSVKHLGELVEELGKRAVGLKVLDLGLDTTNATGKLMLNVVGSVAQFEREIMLERQREGIEKAKREGKYRGRMPSARNRTEDIIALHVSGIKKPRYR